MMCAAHHGNTIFCASKWASQTTVASQPYVAVLEKMGTQDGVFTSLSSEVKMPTGGEEQKKPERRGEWKKIRKMISRLQKVLCMAQALQTDWMWPPGCGDLLWDSQSKSDQQLSPEMGVLVWLLCTGRSAESLPYILDKQNYRGVAIGGSGGSDEPPTGRKRSAKSGVFFFLSGIAQESVFVEKDERTPPTENKSCKTRHGQVRMALRPNAVVTKENQP